MKNLWTLFQPYQPKTACSCPLTPTPPQDDTRVQIETVHLYKISEVVGGTHSDSEKIIVRVKSMLHRSGIGKNATKR